MLNDLFIIDHNLGNHTTDVEVVGIGDVHVGSKECDLDRILAIQDYIIEKENRYCVICGDMMDNGLRNSKTNTYEAVMQPYEQKEWIFENLKPLAEAGRILAVVPGNHEDRSTREVGFNPLYDICCRWGIEDVYRENLAILRIKFGTCGRTDGRLSQYAGIVTHGSSRNKHHKFIACFDGLDFAFSGHTHTPMHQPNGKIKIDSKSQFAQKTGYEEIVLDSGLKSGGYGLKKEYEISTPPKLQSLILHDIIRQQHGDCSGIKQIDYISKSLIY